jgi:hypothetical protein
MKLKQKIQGDMDSHVFKCYCGEYSYLEIVRDSDYKQVYVNITMNPTTIRERLSMAWKSLRGIEFSVSNEVVIDSVDLAELRKALTL